MTLPELDVEVIHRENGTLAQIVLRRRSDEEPVGQLQVMGVSLDQNNPQAVGKLYLAVGTHRVKWSLE